MILQHCPVQYIIGLPTIRQCDLTLVFNDYFKNRHKHKLHAGNKANEFQRILHQKAIETKINKNDINNKTTARAAASTKSTRRPEGRQDPLAAGLSDTVHCV